MSDPFEISQSFEALVHLAATIIRDKAKNSQEKRLRIINEIMLLEGRITYASFNRLLDKAYDEITRVDGEAQKIKDVNRKSFASDLDNLSFILGVPMPKTSDGEYLAERRKFASTREIRSQYQQAAKQTIAELAGGLLLGDEKQFEFERFRVRPRLRPEILRRLDRNDGEASSKAKALKRQLLFGLWANYQRLIGCDAGTTTYALCESILARLKTPRGRLNRLYVCTNSRHIFETLGQPDVRAKAIIVGGGQHPQTEAISGWMSQRFMEAANLRFSISFIGAVSVDLRNGLLGADHDNDCAMKNEFLNRSEIKVILADHSKFSDGAYAASLPFCQISPDCVDLIITDKISGRNASILRSLGVPVLAGGDESEEEPSESPEENYFDDSAEQNSDFPINDQPDESTD